MFRLKQSQILTTIENEGCLVVILEGFSTSTSPLAAALVNAKTAQG